MDPRERLEKARAAAEAGDYELALAEHIWFHRHALKYRPSLYGVRLSFALSDWKRLGDVYPPAIAVLREIRDDKIAALVRGEADRDVFHDVASINRYLGEDRATYELFRKLHQNAPAFAQQCSTLAIDSIVAAKDFQLAQRYSADPESALLAFSEDLNRDVAKHKASPPVKAPRLEAYIHIYCSRVDNMIQTLRGLSKPLEADIAREWAVALIEDRRVRDRVRRALYARSDA